MAFLLLQSDPLAMVSSRNSCPSVPSPSSSISLSFFLQDVFRSLSQLGKIRSRARNSSWVCATTLLLAVIGLAFLENVSANITMTSTQKLGLVPHAKGMMRMMMQAAAANPVTVNQQLQQAVFKGFLRNKTGIPFFVTLPPELSDITVQAVRLRTGKLRNKGFDFNEFHFPIGFMAGNSSIVRVILVYQKFSNFLIYSPPMGKVFGSTVLGMMVYDASNLNDTSPQLPLNMSSAKPIIIKFPATSMTAQPSSGLLLCASYSLTGVSTVSNVDPGTENQCSFTQVGTFAVVEQAPGPVPAQSSMAATESHPQHHLKALKIVLGTIFGSIALIAILLISALGLWKYQQKRHFARMQYQSDQGETLQSSLIGHSRAPAAGSTRTRPTLETLN